MSDLVTRARDPIARTLSWISTRGVEIRSWPSPPGAADDDPVPHPVIYLVEPDAGPPPCGDLEDWVRLPLDVDEFVARADRLVERSRTLGSLYTRVDEDGLLRVGDDIVTLSPFEASIMRMLVDRLGDLVLRVELEAALWPHSHPTDPRAIDNRVKSLRRRLEGVPLRIHTVRGRGLLLERLAG